MPNTQSVEHTILGLENALPPGDAASPLVQIAHFTKGTADAMGGDTTAATYFWEVPYNAILIAAHLIPNGALVANDAAYATVNVESAAGGGGATTVQFSMTTKTAVSGGSGDWAAGRVEPVPVAPTGTGVIPGGSVLAVSIAKAGAGVAVPPFALCVAYKVAN